jgi:hypothetical protein
MNQAVYNTISGFSLLNNYKVHYYFDTYTGGASNAHVFSDADSQYSGKIFSYSGGAHSAGALDLFTGTLGTGTFSGGLNTFYDYISIDNYGDLFSGEFTFLIGSQTTSRQDLGENQKGPVSNNNILFSNLSGGEFAYSGWQIGINAANRIYLESYNGFEPVVVTYMGERAPYSQNIWGIVYEDGAARVGLYNIAEETFSFNKVPIEPRNLQATSTWRIGSGINFDPNVKFSTQLTLNSGLFAGQIDNFLYFNTGLADEEINPLAKSLYSAAYEKTAPTYTSGDTTFQYAGLSGLTGSGAIRTVTTCSETGTRTETVPFTHKEVITGNIGAGVVYYTVYSTGAHPISGTVTGYRALYSTSALTSVITGFSITNHETGIITSLSGCSGVVVSGLLLSGSGIGTSGEGGFTGLVASGVSGVSGDVPSNLRPNAFSYIGTPLTYEAVIEKYNVGSFGVSDKGSLNNLAKLGESRDRAGQGFFIGQTGNSGSLAFYLNGLGGELGGISSRSSSTSRVFYDSTLNKTFAQTNLPSPSGLLDKDNFGPDSDVVKTYFNNYNIVSGDYYVSGLEIVDTLEFPYGQQNILQIYDTGLNTGYIRSRWLVTGTTDYEAPPDPNPISGDQWVFFNGQKLLSGVDYIIGMDDYYSAGAGFTPTGHITGTTGVYFTTPPVAGTTQFTGNTLSFEASEFFPNSNVVFINGVRQDVDANYVEHSSTKDLISGKQTLQTYGVTVYNNNR